MKFSHPTFVATIKYLLWVLGVIVIITLWIPTLGWSYNWFNKLGIKLWGKEDWEKE